jgi:hypothetical protein
MIASQRIMDILIDASKEAHGFLKVYDREGRFENNSKFSYHAGF